MIIRRRIVCSSRAAAALGMGQPAPPVNNDPAARDPGGGVLPSPAIENVENCYILYLGYKLAGPPAATATHPTTRRVIHR